MIANTPMNQIDFLPVEYRLRREQRHAKPWQAFVAVGFLAILTAAVGAQRFQRRLSLDELAAIRPAYETSLQQEAELAALKNRLASLKAETDFIAYLRHPWPRTQILASLAAILPNEITLQQLDIYAEAAKTVVQERRPGKPEETKRLLPAEENLKALRAQCDDRPIVVMLTGTTADPAALHRYLDEVDSLPLFTKAELISLTNVPLGQNAGGPPGAPAVENAEAAPILFRAMIVARPGYGQPGGPIGSASKKSEDKKLDGAKLTQVKQ